MIIADTNIFITLSKINNIFILQKLYNHIDIPQAVYDELKAKDDNCFKQVKEAKFIKTLALDELQKQKAEEIRHDLFLSNNEIKKNNKTKHLGECQAIVLLMDEKQNEKLFLTDDYKARIVCSEDEEIKKFLIHTTGSIGVIIQAYRENLLNYSSAFNCINELEKLNPNWDKELFNGARNTISIEKINKKN